MSTTPDPALRRALELQIAALIPIAANMGEAVAHPPIAPTEWHGPASSAYSTLQARMRSRLLGTEREVTAALEVSRIAFGDLSG